MKACQPNPQRSPRCERLQARWFRRIADSRWRGPRRRNRCQDRTGPRRRLPAGAGVPRGRRARLFHSPANRSRIGRWRQLVALAACLAYSPVQAATHLCAWRLASSCRRGLWPRLETGGWRRMMLGAEISTRLTGTGRRDRPHGQRPHAADPRCLSTERPTLRYAPERVRLTAREAAAGAWSQARQSPATCGCCRRPGRCDRAATTIRSKAISTASAPAAFSCRGRAGRRSAEPARQRGLATVENAREPIAEPYRGTVGGAEGEIAAALIVGVRAGIPEDVNEAMRQDRHLPHHLDFRPAHGAGRRHGHGADARGVRAVSRISRRAGRSRSTRPARAVGHRRLSRHFGRGGRGRTQLHHAGGHADGGAVRPRGAHHAQSRDLGHRRHRRVAA